MKRSHLLFFVLVSLCVLLIISCLPINKLFIKFPGLKKILKEEPPLTTSLSDAVTGCPLLDDFNPTEFIRMEKMKRSSNGNFLLNPGLYELNTKSYCLKAGSYEPGGGDGYIYAPFKGPHAHIVRNIIRRSIDHPIIPQPMIQTLIWAVIAHVQFNEMSGLTKIAALILLKPKEIFELNSGAIGVIPDKILKKAISNLPLQVRQVINAGNDLRRMIVRANTTYEELEQIAVLFGDPPLGRDSRDVPLGRWSFHHEGYFVRYFSAGYTRIKVQVSVPDKNRIEMDDLGRIISIANKNGRKIETMYNDSVEPLNIPGDDGIKGYAFRSIKLLNCKSDPPEIVFEIEFSDIDFNWTFVGVPFVTNDIELSSVLFRELPDRYASAKMEKKWLDKLNEHLALESIGNIIMDLGHYVHAIYNTIDSSDFDNKSLLTPYIDLIKEAWQYALCERGGAISSSNETDNTETTIEYDPTAGVAVPGNTSRQRLGISPKPEEEPEEEEQLNVTISGAGPLLLVKETATVGSPPITLTASGSPSGGSYAWTVLSGSHKIQVLSGYNGTTFMLKAKSADQNRDDVIIEVKYTTPEGTTTDQVYLTVYKPSGCELIDAPKTDFTGPDQYGYEVVAKYQILDQFNQPYPRWYLDVEVVDVILANPHNVTHEAGNFTSDANANCYDHYVVKSSAPIPSNFIFIIHQTYRASGFEIAEQEVEYGPSDIEINRIW